MCSACHSVSEDELRLVGPGLWDIGNRSAEERLSETDDETVVEYIYASIVNPQAYIVPGDPAYPENLMPPNYEEVLTEDELNGVIAYLLSLE